MEHKIPGGAACRAMFLPECFGITDNEQNGTYLSAAAIFNELKQKYGSGMIGNSLLSFGRKLKNIMASNVAERTKAQSIL